MNIRTLLKAAAILTPLTILSVAAAAATIVTVNPINVTGATDAPFYLDFTLTGSDGNSVMLSNFDLNGGLPIGPPVVTNDALGSLGSSIQLGDSAFYNDIYQQFTVGARFSFNLSMTSLTGTFPDTFSVSILDQNLLPVPTLDPTGANTLLTINLGPIPQILTYASDPSQSGGGVTYPTFAAPVLTPAAAVPEPTPFVLLAVGLTLLLGVTACRSRTTAARLCVAALATIPMYAQSTVCSNFYQVTGSPYSLTSTLGAGASATGDFDGDGIPDAVVSNYGADTLILLKGDGHGGFSPFAQSPLTIPASLTGNNSDWVASIAVADFNGDRKMDLAVVTFQGYILMLLGSGNGAFTLPPAAIATVGPNAIVTAADINKDGSQDLVVSSGTTTLIFLNNGAGTLQYTGTIYAVGYPVAIDLNGDGYPDLAGGSAASAVVFLNNQHGGFTAGTPVAMKNNAGAPFFAAGDFNGDGKLDIAAFGRNSVTLQGSIWILTGDGQGGLTPVANTPYNSGTNPPFGTTGLIAADLDGDGVLDLALAGQNSVALLKGTGAAGFAQFPGSPLLIIDTGAMALMKITGAARPYLLIPAQQTTIAQPGKLYVYTNASQIATIGMTSSANPGVVGQALTLQAVVGGGSCTDPSGTVTYYDNSTVIGISTLSPAGLASLSLPAGMASGIHTLTATYSGDNNYAPASVKYVEFIGASSCSTNVTAQVRVTPGGFVYDRAHQQFVQTVTVLNTGQPITGPVSLALDALSSNASVASPAGYTSCAAPSNSPYVDLGICPGGTLASGGSVQATVRFTDPTMASISYTPQVLAGLAVP